MYFQGIFSKESEPNEKLVYFQISEEKEIIFSNNKKVEYINKEGKRTVLEEEEVVKVLNVNEWFFFVKKDKKELHIFDKKVTHSLDFGEKIEDISKYNGFVVVVMENKIQIVETQNLRKGKIVTLYQTKTAPNPHGINTFVFREGKLSLGFPGKGEGIIEIHQINLEDSKVISISTIKAHLSEIRNMKFSPDGNEIATSSTRSTLINVFSLKPGYIFGKNLYSFRRGITNSTIYSMCYSPNTKYIAISSSNGTIHVFCFAERVEKVSMFKPWKYWTNTLRASIKYSTPHCKLPNTIQFADNNTLLFFNENRTLLTIKFDFLSENNNKIANVEETEL